MVLPTWNKHVPLLDIVVNCHDISAQLYSAQLRTNKKHVLKCLQLKYCISVTKFRVWLLRHKSCGESQAVCFTLYGSAGLLVMADLFYDDFHSPIFNINSVVCCYCKAHSVLCKHRRINVPYLLGKTRARSLTCTPSMTAGTVHSF